MDCPDIISAVKQRGLVWSGERLLVAVSGGPDSIALLHALHARSLELGITLCAAHFNHGLRGEASDLDAEFAAEFANSLQVPIIIEKAQGWPSGVRVNEEAARQARFEFLRRAASDAGASKIAIGHTADDRAESVLLNLLRGTGIRGLAAIRPIQGDIVRPLIDATRKDVETYIAANGLRFRVDESNADTSYARNWIRLEVIPLLQQRYPEVKNALVRLAEIASDQCDLMDGLVSMERARVELGPSLDAELTAAMPRALLRELVRSEIQQAKGDLKDVTYEQVERVVSALMRGADFTFALPTGEIYAARKGSSFRIYERKARPTPTPFAMPIEVPGETFIEQRGLKIVAERLVSVGQLRTGPDVVTIDEESIDGRLIARNVRPGDRITPFGMAGAPKSPGRGTKKLQDVFTDNKVPREVRERAVVVCDDRKILWVVGVVASEYCRVTDKTRSIIRLRADIAS